ncbi:MAG: alanyl-tRNA editing protein [Burkholderiales bacterium]|nr:MAG: alanyl-tRNA editing protein [Burkholderiales bacterium]
MSTEALFRADAYLRECTARVVSVGPEGVLLDRTVFYPLGGGQAADTGTLTRDDGQVIVIGDTRKSRAEGAGPDDALHVPAPESAEAAAALRPGDAVVAAIDWDRRHRHMRLHTSTHLLCALVPHPVDGCSITSGYARLDFATVEPLDRELLQAGLERLIAGAHPVAIDWITDDELAAQPDLVRTMSVKPPMGFGRVRLLRIDGVDLQPCGGTHVSNTAEIGALRIAKIEKKSARTRRVTIEFA